MKHNHLLLTSKVVEAVLRQECGLIEQRVGTQPPSSPVEDDKGSPLPVLATVRPTNDNVVGSDLVTELGGTGLWRPRRPASARCGVHLRNLAGRTPGALVAVGHKALDRVGITRVRITIFLFTPRVPSSNTLGVGRFDKQPSVGRGCWRGSRA